MTSRVLTAALTIVLAAGSAHAEAKLPRSLKKAMLDESGKVNVLVRWKRGASQPALAGARYLPLFGISAVTLTPEKVEELAKSSAVDAIFHDQQVALEEPRIPETVAELEQQEQKMLRTWGVNAIEAHRVHGELGITGKGVRVGVVDTGIDGLHPMFRDKLLGWHDFTGVLSPTPQDDNGHGSHCAGTIAGTTTPSGVQIGVAPGASLLVARVLGKRQGSDFSILAGLAFCADPDGNPDTDDGARVINCSFGHRGVDQESDQMWNDAIGFLAKRNIICAVAAGNDGDDGEDTVGAPGYLENSFTVGATNLHSNRASFSSYSSKQLGNRPVHWMKPDISAPGVSVLSTRENNVIGRMDGTSMATPHVAGVIALVCEANPKLTAVEIRELLEATATDLGDTGRDNQTGAGLINAYKAVKRAIEMKGEAKVAKSDADLLTEGQRLMVGSNLPAANQRFMRIIHSGNFAADTTQAAMYYLSEGYFRQANYRGALSGFAKLHEIAPKSPWGAKAFFQIGKCYKETPVNGTSEALLTYTKAEAAFAKFMADYPEHEWVALAGVERANSLASMGRGEEAGKLLVELLQRFPNRPEVVAAAELLEKLGNGVRDPLAQ